MEQHTLKNKTIQHMCIKESNQGQIQSKTANYLFDILLSQCLWAGIAKIRYGAIDNTPLAHPITTSKPPVFFYKCCKWKCRISTISQDRITPTTKICIWK